MYNREAINILLWKAEMPCLNVWGVSQASQLCDRCHMSPELCTTNIMDMRPRSLNTCKAPVTWPAGGSLSFLFGCPARCASCLVYFLNNKLNTLDPLRL